MHLTNKRKMFLTLLTLFCMIFSLFSFPNLGKANPVKINPICSPPIDFSNGFTEVYDSNDRNDNNGWYSVPTEKRSAGVDSLKHTDQKQPKDFKFHIQNLTVNNNFQADDKIYLVFDKNNCYVELNVGHTKNIEDLGDFKIYVGSGWQDDDSAPNLAILKVENITSNSADIKVRSNEISNVFYLIKETDDDAPDVADLLQSNYSKNVTENQVANLNIINLEENTAYTVYAMAVDLDGNVSLIKNIDFKTLGTSEASLDFSVYPTDESGSYTIDPETGVAEGGVTAKVIPQGVADIGNRTVPIDVVFIFDTSGSMTKDMSDCSWSGCDNDKAKFSKAKAAAGEAIEKFRTNAVDGDRFAFIPFSDQVDEEDVIEFNNTTSQQGVSTQLDQIKTAISNLHANGDTNYQAALTKANSLFNTSPNPKYIIFLTDGQPTAGSVEVSKEVNGYFKRTGSIFRYDYIQNATVNITEKEYSTWLFGRKVKRLVFNYSGHEYIYRDNDMPYLAGLESATALAQNNIKLFSIGLGSDVNMEYLKQLSKLTGGTAQQGEKDELETIYEDITNEINDAALRDIKLRIKVKDPNLPGNVGIKEYTNETEEPIDSVDLPYMDGDYAVLSFEDIKFGLDETAPTPESVEKQLPLIFDSAGVYNFDDVQLSYIDLNGTKVIKNTTFSVKIKGSSLAAPDVAGGIEKVVVTGAEPGAQLKLFTKDGQEFDSDLDAIADEDGNYTFVNVLPGKDYYVIQIHEGVESDPSNFVDVKPAQVTVAGEEKRIIVSDAYEGATLTLYNVTTVVATIEADSDGIGTFVNVPAGTYTVTQTVNGVKSDKSEEVTIVALQSLSFANSVLIIKVGQQVSLADDYINMNPDSLKPLLEWGMDEQGFDIIDLKYTGTNKGTIKGKKEGYAIVAVKYGNLEARITIIVEKQNNTSPGGNGNQNSW